MALFKMIKIHAHERGLLFKDGEFAGLVGPGRRVLTGALRKLRVDVVSVRDPWLRHKDLEVIVRSGALKDEALVLDLKDRERALVWIDGRFAAVLKPGLHALWTVFRKVRVEAIDATDPRVLREDLAQLATGAGAGEALELFGVEPEHAGLYYKDGAYVATLGPGTHAFWKGIARVRIAAVDLREQVLDIAGQEIMTADKVTLRLNAVVTYRVADPLKTVAVAGDCKQALYRDAQLALRAGLGARDLDTLLAEKNGLAAELEGVLKDRAKALGLEVLGFGIRDVILPGEMKDLLNKVTEAKKAAEASLITRREETAAMRMQANTAKILESNPTLMRLRELEVLEKVAEKSKLNVLLGEKGLTERVVKLL
ncbi:MAG: slipin family protein [Planctomycetota bacterium]|nr:slipin family protein [Planctomycetota bacterium]